MSFVLRAARPDDLAAIYQMAKSTGGGFTNLPPDRPALLAKLEAAMASFQRTDDSLTDDRFFFVLEDAASGKVRGTCQIFSKVGSAWPFYSYRKGVVTQYSKELDRTFRAEMLTLCTDLDGTSEVGGLYLHPQERSSGSGMLLARSRYLFIKGHRSRFADRTIAELRGAHDETGGSPFWDGLAGRFFGMTFPEADQFNAVFGNQFIADLMPKHPIYTAMLPESALAVMGAPHHSGRAAMRMLESEGFRHDHYLDIFDGGPTVTIETDNIATIRNAREAQVAEIAPLDGAGQYIVATGRLDAFRACYGQVLDTGQDCVRIDPQTASLLKVGIGDTIVHVVR